MATSDAESIGKAFATFYYTQYDNNRSQLASVYVPQSVMMYEGDMRVGSDSIMQKLTTLTFQRVQHMITTVDSQPTIDQSVLVTVLGQLKTDDDAPHSFAETFNLKQLNGSFVILNQVFRLVLHHM